MNGLKKFTQVLAKILEVCNWVALGFMLVIFILTFVPGDIYTTMFFHENPYNVALNAYGYEIVVYPTESLSLIAVRLFAAGAFFIYGLMAMVFRDVSLIIKTMRGETKYSVGQTPFQKDVTRMVREIGIFSLAIVVVNFIFSTIASVIVGSDMVGSSLNLILLMIGLLMLCLSSAFAEGEELQQDVDGLV